MLYRLFALSGFLFYLIFTGPAKACDPNESCNRCLISAFGHCVQSGNDPICEIRKKSCQVTPILNDTPGLPFGPGGLLAPGGPIPGLTMDRVQGCLTNLPACPGQILSQLGYEAIRPIVEAYIGFLENQVGNNVRNLDPSFISKIQPYYPIDLNNVRYATNINTIHGANMTVGDMIYFTSDLDLDDDYDAKLVYHELQHVVQYARRGSVESFLTEYVLKSGGSILHGGNSLDVHDNIDLEHEAIMKANQVEAAIASGGGSMPPTNIFQPSGMGLVCRTPFGGCLLPMLGTIGQGCFCGTLNGPVQGGVSPN